MPPIRRHDRDPVPTASVLGERNHLRVDRAYVVRVEEAAFDGRGPQDSSARCYLRRGRKIEGARVVVAFDRRKEPIQLRVRGVPGGDLGEYHGWHEKDWGVVGIR